MGDRLTFVDRIHIFKNRIYYLRAVSLSLIKYHLKCFPTSVFSKQYVLLHAELITMGRDSYYTHLVVNCCANQLDSPWSLNHCLSNSRHKQSSQFGDVAWSKTIVDTCLNEQRMKAVCSKWLLRVWLLRIYGWWNHQSWFHCNGFCEKGQRFDG